MTKTTFPLSNLFEDQRIVTLSILFLLIILLPVEVFPFSPQPDSAPSFFTAIPDMDGKIPLYWFKPGINPEEKIFDDGTKELQFNVFDQWYENCAAEKFFSPSTPFVLLKSKVFISYQGRPGDALYDSAAQFFITINKNDHGKPGFPFSEPVYAKASGNGVPEGEWVEIEHNLLITEDTFWVVFHWLKETPTSPLIGADDSTNNKNSFWGWKKDGYWQWNKWSYNLMIRCLLLSNGMQTSLSPGGYKLYRGDTSDFPLSPASLLRTFPADSFYCLDDQVTNGKSYYYKLTALYSGQESDTSNEVQATPRLGAFLQSDLDSLEVLLPSGQKKVEYLQLSNPGGLPLDYNIEFELSLDDSTKGTDSYGYYWSDNLTRKSLSYDWMDISQRGVLINSVADKNKVYGPIPLNFLFPFYGNLYDSLWISTNGVLSFYPWELRFVNQPLPCAQGYFSLIAPLWSNLTLNQDSKIYLYRSSDSLIVSFIDIKYFKNGTLFTFQVILTKQGSIDFQYEKLSQSNDTATVGIQNEDGTSALLISYNQDYLRDSLRIRINPPYLQVSPMKGKINPGENQTIKLAFDSYFLSQGLFKGKLKVFSQDKNHSLNPLSLPVVLNVDTTTSVQNAPEQIPVTFKLGQNYPNPFNPLTTIPFKAGSRKPGAGSPTRTTLKIYNVLGQLVKTLVDEEKSPGNYQVIWDGKDQKGDEVSSGIYFYQLRTGNYKETRKMSLLR
ncbi:MAG: T9SS type A sorting domain-containing protein [candidate division Zixibacteria bacterium]|nr:T9SS type A sorting domain-containing protein [candidate division Zixibacteria bacterium]